MTEQVWPVEVTNEMLAAWGFPVERWDKCAGIRFKADEGMPRAEAVAAAVAAGFVRDCLMQPRDVVARVRAEREAAAEARKPTPAQMAEAWAWVAENCREGRRAEVDAEAARWAVVARAAAA